MNKKNSNLTKSNKTKLITFWSLISLFTIAFIVIIIVMFIELRPFEDYSDIKESELELVGKELFENKETEYFVYIYNSNKENNIIDTEKAEELKPIVFNYFNFVRQHSRRENVIKIFGFDVKNSVNKVVVGKTNSSIEQAGFENFKVNEAELPMLVLISDGKINSRNIYMSEIQDTLQDAMDIKAPVFEAILPSKEDYFFL
jgi:hypothetical protein